MRLLFYGVQLLFMVCSCSLQVYGVSQSARSLCFVLHYLLSLPTRPRLHSLLSPWTPPHVPPPSTPIRLPMFYCVCACVRAVLLSSPLFLLFICLFSDCALCNSNNLSAGFKRLSLAFNTPFFTFLTFCLSPAWLVWMCVCERGHVVVYLCSDSFWMWYDPIVLCVSEG